MTYDLKTFADAVMRGVVASGVVTEANIQRAVDVMRAEAAAFFTGDEYAAERAAARAASITPAYVVASIVASCVIKIRAGDAAPESVP